MSEKDRYLFLKALLLTKDQISVSYVGVSKSDRKPIGPSLLISEILHHFEKPFTKIHPPFPFSKEYLTQVNFSPKQYRLASSYYFPTPKEASAPLQKDDALEEDRLIDVQSLFQLTRHPIKLFCNQVLGVYLNTREIDDSSEFFLSYLDRTILARESLFSDQGSTFSEALEKNRLPTALFLETARQEIEAELLEKQNNLKEIGLTPCDLFTIYLDPACKEAGFLDTHRFIHPALHLEPNTTFYGKIENVTKMGLYIDASSSISEVWKYLPHLLLLSQLNFPTTLIFAKDAKARTFDIELPKKRLLLLTSYYLEACKSASPLMPDRIENLLAGKVERFEKQVAEGGYYDDPYLTFLKPDLSKDWKPMMEELCKNLTV